MKKTEFRKVALGLFYMGIAAGLFLAVGMRWLIGDSAAYLLNFMLAFLWFAAGVVNIKYRRSG